MTDLEGIRAERYEIAKAILAGTFGIEREQSEMEAVRLESSRIATLELQIVSARSATTELLEKTEASVVQVESAAQQAAKDLNSLQTAVDTNKRNQARQKGALDIDAHRDSETYATATALLNDRIRLAQDRLVAAEKLIDSYEPGSFLKNPEAQSLYLQLRALLAAQEKELRTFLRPLTKTS
jgi:hypothetical protein